MRKGLIDLVNRVTGIGINSQKELGPDVVGEQQGESTWGGGGRMAVYELVI